MPRLPSRLRTWRPREQQPSVVAVVDGGEAVFVQHDSIHHIRRFLSIIEVAERYLSGVSVEPHPIVAENQPKARNTDSAIAAPIDARETRICKAQVLLRRHRIRSVSGSDRLHRATNRIHHDLRLVMVNKMAGLLGDLPVARRREPCQVFL